MPEIWREFILRYSLRLPFVSLETILKAFYYFEGNRDESDKVMGVNLRQPTSALKKGEV